MRRYYYQKDFLIPFAVWVVFLVWYFIFGGSIFQPAQIYLDDIVKSHSFWLFHNPPKEKETLTIVAIDRESRRRLNRNWPWQRSASAELIRNIVSYSPKVIGLDIIFSGQSDEANDRELISALSKHNKIISACIVDAQSQVMPAPKFTSVLKGVGFINKPLENERVRSLRPVYRSNEKTVLFSIELEIVKEYLGLETKDIVLTENQINFGDQINIPVRNNLTQLNYLVFHKNFKTIPAYKVLENQVNPLDFKNKIVLIGATDPIVHDEYSTVLGVFPGVTIIANSLVMLLSQRFVADLPGYQSIVVSIVLSIAVFLFCRRYSIVSSFVLFLMVLSLSFAAFVFFRSKDLRLPYFTVLYFPSTAYLSLNLFKYLHLLYVGKKIKDQAIYDPSCKLYSFRYFDLLVQEKIKARSPLILIGLRIWNYTDIEKELNFDQIRSLMKNISDTVEEIIGKIKKCKIASLSPDTLGILVEDHNIDKISEQLKTLSECTVKFGENSGITDVPLNLKAIIIYKLATERLKNHYFLQQFANTFDKMEAQQNILVERMIEADNLNIKEKISLGNDWDFVAYDWAEKTKELEKSLKSQLETNKRLNRLNIGIINTLSRSIDAKSPWTAGHSKRVAQTAVQIGKYMGLSRCELLTLHKGALLHDIGKIGISSSILNKPDRLTQEEYRKVCEHPQKGGLILAPIDEFKAIIPMIVQHHEWFNGKGYPEGLAGENISLEARILALADVYDAVRSARPYRSAMPIEKVFDIIESGSGTQFDPEVVNAFFEFVNNNKMPDELIINQKKISPCNRFEPRQVLYTPNLCIR